MSDNISPDYGTFTAEEYAARINTPAQNPLYYRQFHRPLIEEASRNRFNPAIVDIGAGHAHELAPVMRDFPDARLVAVDSSKKTLLDSTMGRIRSKVLLALDPGAKDISRTTEAGYEEFTVNDAERLSLEIRRRIPCGNITVAADVRDLEHMTSGFADAGIALNAVVYVPFRMLRGLRACLKKGASASVNFRNASNPFNEPFFSFYTDDGGILQEGEVDAGGFTMPARVLDYRSCGDIAIRSLDRQTYLTSVTDMEKMIRAAGFEVGAHDTFHFASPANPDNEIDVFGVRAV